MKRGKKRMAAPVFEKMDGPTPEQLANGRYDRDFTTHVESNTLAMTHVSRHDPVERWIRDKRLTDGQRAAIGLCQRLWSLCGLQQPVTASYGERQPAGYGVEKRALMVIEAREDLHRIQDYFRGLEKWWAIYENVCRHGMAAGVAGGESDRNGSNKAYHVVCFVADIIAVKERL